MSFNNTKLYDNGYKSEHSKQLRNKFNIDNRGVDWYNNNNVGFEFKESYAKDEKNIWFKLPKKQLEESHFTLISIHGKEFHIIRNSDVLDEYPFNTYKNRANIRVNSIRAKSIFNSFDLDKVEEFMKKLTMDDI